jgi:transcriptional regulator with XRE-family HTH domain
MSQEEFAKLLGISRITFAQIEQGERDVKHSELVTIANNFEMNIKDLISDEHITPTPPQAGKDEPFYKFKQVFLYILNKCAQKPNVGKTVINKLLYFADFNYYEKYWKNITGVNYLKKPR